MKLYGMRDRWREPEMEKSCVAERAVGQTVTVSIPNAMLRSKIITDLVSKRSEEWVKCARRTSSAL